MRDSVSDLAFATGWSAVRRLPAPAAGALFRGIADATWLRHGDGVRQLEANLRRVVPDASEKQLRDLSRESMRAYLRYWCEAFRLPDLSREQLFATFRCDDEHYLSDALASGRGVILVLPHMGNWDHAGAWVSLAHQPITTVAERLKPESLYERFLAYRRKLGMEVLPMSGGTAPYRVLLDRARAGGLVCLLGDRDLTEHGVPVELFGDATKMPAGPASLAVASGAVLMPVTLWYDAADGVNAARIHPEVYPPTEGSRTERVAVMTQQVADVFEKGIAEHPADWHMLQRLWLADLRERPS